MAFEGVLYRVGEVILNQLGSQASNCLGMLYGLNDGLHKLSSNVSSIQVVLRDAEDRQMKGDGDHSLKNWLEKLGGVYYDVEDVVDEILTETCRREVMTRGKFAKQVRNFFSNSNQLTFNYRMACQVKNINERLHYISKEKYKFNLKPNVEMKTPHASSHPTDSSLSGEIKVIGREDDISNLRKLLLVEDKKMKANVSFIAIVGMNGIGKTTLAKALYNDKDVSDYFTSRIWISVSDEKHFRSRTIFTKIIESATGNECNVYEIKALKIKLKKVIEGKKYLLVIDDVWNETDVEWDHLKNMLMFGARGSKVLITTHDVSKVDEEVETFSLKDLSEDHSWSLFKEVAFDESDHLRSTNPKLIQLGNEISKKCGGIPIVIRHIGRLLHKNTSEEDWESVKNNKLLNVTHEQSNNDDDDVLSRLKLCYNHLPSNLKQCFAYTSLFPKGYKISMNDLIRQWVAQGFIQSSDGGKSMEDIGEEYLNELCRRFFYEISSDGIVCMHDVMRDLAREVAGKKLYVRGGPKNVCDVSEQTRHISFDCNIKSWEEEVLSKLCKAKGLRTFIFLLPDFYRGNKMNGTVMEKLFSSFPRLRVLGLRNSRILEMSESIKKLKHLRYLNLSEIEPDLASLPNSITELQNLQTLNLNGSLGVKDELGLRDIRNLVNLRHLILYSSSYESIDRMPRGMEKLSHLQTLNLFVFDCKEFNKLRQEFNELNCFIVELRIIGLDELRSIPYVLNSINLKDKRSNPSLKLEWKLGTDNEEYHEGCDEKILEGLEPHPNVKSLSIKGYCGVGLPNNWASTLLPSLNYLNVIKIISCPRLQHLNHLSHLPTLQSLYLWDLTSLMSLSEWIGNLTSLVYLDIRCCAKLKSLPKEMRQLKYLKEIYMMDCPQLENRCKKGGEDWPNISHVRYFTYED